MADDDKLQCTLDRARTCLYKGLAPQSLEYLRDIQADLDDLYGTSLWAQHQLIYACALAAMNESGAEAAFEDTLGRVSALSEPDLALEMTAQQHYANYLAGRRATKLARQHYQRAEKIANSLGREQDVAHIQMCVIRIGLEESKNPQLVAFQRLQAAAKEGYTEVQQREAWIHYMDQFEEIEPQLVAARKGAEASLEYFRGVLSEIRRNRR
jgi:hypothetical protein